MEKVKKAFWILMALSVIYLAISIYFFNPILNIHYKDGISILIPFAVGLYLWEMRKKQRLEKINIKFSLFLIPFIVIGFIILIKFPVIMIIPIIANSLYEKKKKIDPAQRIRLSKYILLGILAYLIIIPFLASTPIFRSSSYRELIGKVQIADDLSEIYPPSKTSSIRVVDQDMALRLGEKVLGSDPSLGSQSRLGTFRIQSVNDRLYWVAPLLHSGFFKWMENRQGTRGYVMVSATDDSDVKLVQQTSGEEVLIKYQPSAFWGDKLKRYIYFRGYMGRGYSDFTFEIDDEGHPYWVVTLYKKRVGFRGEDATGVLLVDCKSGDLMEYGINDAPEWIDRIQPEDFIVNQLDYWGELVHGALNFSGKDKLTTTPGMSLVYGKEGQPYWYTGLTTVGSNEGIVGFILVNTRTKETFWYKQAGATEWAARRSAEGKVQEKRYRATQPVMYNISGNAAYIMSLTDDAGLVKMFAAVPVDDYTAVEVADSLEEVLYLFKTARGDHLQPMEEEGDQEISWKKIEGSVLRIASEVEKGNSVYYLIVSEAADTVFYGRSRISKELPLTQPGDRITITYPGEDEAIIEMKSFDNLELVAQ